MSKGGGRKSEELRVGEWKREGRKVEDLREKETGGGGERKK